MLRIKALLFCGLVSVVFVVPVNAQKDLPRAEAKPSEAVNSPILRLSSVPLFSNPVGAEVYLNNKLLGVTTAEGKLVLGKTKPKTLTLKAGKYKLTFKHFEYETYIEEVVLNNGETKAVTGTLKPKFGFLVLTNIPKDATFFLNGLPLEEKNVFWQEDGSLKLKAPLGEHVLKVTLAGHQSFLSQCKIKDDSPTTVGVELKKLLTSLTVKSNPGARVYLDNEERGTISVEGKLILNELIPEKRYTLSIEREGYKKFEKEVTLLLSKENFIEESLTLLPNSSEFIDYFKSLAFWDSPKSWQAENGFLKVSGKEVGLPKERNYCNATVVFGLRLGNSQGASWVVRAQDKENYYLFCLNGSSGTYPNSLVTYICRKGKYDLTQPVTTPFPIPIELKSGQTYRIQILIKENKIQHILTDNNTGDEISIGFFLDDKNLYPCGNVGFISPTGEPFEAYGFVITPNN
jgi:hypothetical protein